MRIDVVSIFPDLIEHWFSQGVVGRALGKGFALHYHNPRDYSDDKHRRIDDRPFGGGSGMLMQYEPLARTAEALQQAHGRGLNIFLSPQGERFNHAWAARLAQEEHLVFWCGRYEGVDQRFIERHIDLELSLGDFVLSGGELAAAVMLDAILRLRDGVLGNANSAREDSFYEALLDCPHYTRPEKIDTLGAPEILLSGHHAAIARWRMKQALGQTFLRRPDLFSQLVLNDTQRALLNEFLNDWSTHEQDH